MELGAKTAICCKVSSHILIEENKNCVDERAINIVEIHSLDESIGDGLRSTMYIPLFVGYYCQCDVETTASRMIVYLSRLKAFCHILPSHTR